MKLVLENKDLGEAVRDCARSNGIAAVIEFAKSDCYPGPRERVAYL